MRATRNRHERLLELIGKVYDAALDEKLWITVSLEIAATFDAPSTALQLRDIRNGTVNLLSVSKNYDAKSLMSYESYYAPRDPWVLGASRLDMSTVITTQELMEPADLERSEFYNDWCRPLGLFHLVGALLRIDEGEIAALGIIRSRGGERFEAPDKALVSAFLPHLQRALQMRRRLLLSSMEWHAALEALDRTATATLVVGRDGGILFANRKADDLFREGDAIRSFGNRLTVVGRGESGRLADAIRAAANTASGHGTASGGMVVLERLDRLPLTVLVAPFRPALDGLGTAVPAAILFIRDPEALSPAGQALQALFGLTPAEAAVANALADGKSVDEIAASAGITLNTARTHLKNIFAKTGTNRQATLVGLLLRSVAILGAPETERN
ncbi:MAG TPA: helix-turn-helix transcriptional regulator [Stellaceae bacterium]